mmetsp:Transcript_35707/g.43074  ORF Transcript_35707/g.43074 Transcript_35707/m.43074 type:complete len:495 (-) Transcript_35707:253-1737(-)|eukprot:CAMPEP_0197849404 /NCGR_PEP_ID=MMETSP1438-20131217/11929_1 /TAXON_ID=1461541 /ORGANISM="Pterosperma sp., Strain CCMP1384" /LENGTH=494 /DNA_ID=CAMNT_0043462069 /DNA_START=156 /DNA_END=1640 /DNA_ORIENTATION=-
MGRGPKNSSKKKKDKQRREAAAAAAASSDAMMDDEEFEEENEEEEEPQMKVWRPGVDELADDEELVFDPSAYDCLHNMRLQWPCLSFDIIRDQLGDGRNQFPHSMLVVTGTQAANPKANTLTVMRVTQLSSTHKPSKAAKADGEEDDSDSDEEDSDSEDEEIDLEDINAGETKMKVRKPGTPVLHVRQVAHHGGVNRIRVCPQQPNLVSTWADSGHVQVWDVTPQLQAVLEETAEVANEAAAAKITKAVPKAIFNGHTDEGFAMDWSPVDTGRLLTGDCAGVLHLWQPDQNKWNVGQSAFRGHQGSVEDIQWSPSEATVFSTCGVDKTIKIWDTRQKGVAALSVAAHDDDINVLSWSRITTCMLASGCDDGCFRIWDLRNFKDNNFVAQFKYHQAPITSIEWSPSEGSVLATSSADNQLTVWDLSVERDAEEEADAMASSDVAMAAAPDELPAQLMFVHQGQTDIKEHHFHPQIPGMIVSTAGDGFNFFRPSNM